MLSFGFFTLRDRVHRPMTTIGSVLGPVRNRTPTALIEKVDADFYGTVLF